MFLAFLKSFFLIYLFSFYSIAFFPQPTPILSIAAYKQCCSFHYNKKNPKNLQTTFIFKCSVHFPWFDHILKICSISLFSLYSSLNVVFTSHIPVSALDYANCPLELFVKSCFWILRLTLRRCADFQVHFQFSTFLLKWYSFPSYYQVFWLSEPTSYMENHNICMFRSFVTYRFCSHLKGVYLRRCYASTRSSLLCAYISALGLGVLGCTKRRWGWEKEESVGQRTFPIPSRHQN